MFRKVPVADINLQSLWTTLDSDSPSGVNLEYDARFVEMMRLAEGTREQQYGDTIVAAQPPDWRSVQQIGVKLASETRDIRVAATIVEAMTHENGLSGLSESLQLLRHWICDFWDSIHPQLDPDDNHDPFVRINSLGRLCEAERLPKLIGKIAIVEAPPHVTVTINDVLPRREESQGSPRSDRLTNMEIEAAFLSVSLTQLRELFHECESVTATLRETVLFLDANAGEGIWDASLLFDQIDHCTTYVKGQLRSRLAACDSVVADVAAAGADDVACDTSSTDWSPESVDESISSLSRIRVNSRDDASHVIEAATLYFERNEPSSPVPLLLRRAKRLINQDFVDILRDLAPDALIEARKLAGNVEE